MEFFLSSAPVIIDNYMAARARDPSGSIDIGECSLPISLSHCFAALAEDRIEDISEMFSKITGVS